MCKCDDECVLYAVSRQIPFRELSVGERRSESLGVINSEQIFRKAKLCRMIKKIRISTVSGKCIDGCTEKINVLSPCPSGGFFISCAQNFYYRRALC